MSSGHVDPTIKTAVQNNTVFDAVLDATAILNWRNEIAAKIDGNYDDAQAKAPLVSPTFTGTPAVPTPAVDTNTTQAVSAAFVLAQAASANPLMDGTVAVGASTRFARGDHRHPSDTTKVTGSSGTGSPIGIVTPTAAGQLYLDQLTGLNYVSNGVTNTSWVVETQFYGMSIQAIINAAMEVWQQGTTFTNPADNAYTADMWVVGIVNTGTLPTSIIHSQSALTVGELFNSKYAYKVNVNGAGSGFGTGDSYVIKQRIELGTSKLCGNGKKITVSFYAKSNIANKKIGVYVGQNYGTGGSPSTSEIITPTSAAIRTMTATMSLYTFTFTTTSLTGKTFGTNNDDFLSIAINLMWGTAIASTYLGGSNIAETFVGAGDVYFTEVVVNAGDTALPFQPKSFDDELKSCQRYYEKSYNYSTPPGTATAPGGIANYFGSATIASSQPYGTTRYKVLKRTMAAVVTIYPYTTPTNTGRVSGNDGVDLAAGSGSVVYGGDSGFTVYNSSGGSLTPSGSSVLFHWSADARL